MSLVINDDMTVNEKLAVILSRKNLKYLGLVVDHNSRQWVYKNGLLAHLVQDLELDYVEVTDALNDFRSFGFVSIGQLEYPAVSFDKAGQYYELDFDFDALSIEDWEAFAERHISVDSGRGRPIFNLKVNFDHFIREVLGYGTRVSQYADHNTNFFAAAFTVIERNYGGIFERDLRWDTTNSQRYEADIPVIRWNVEDAIKEFGSIRGDRPINEDYISRAIYTRILGETVYYDFDSIPEQVQEWAIEVMDDHGWIKRDNSYEFVVKPVEIDEARVLEILESVLADKTLKFRHKEVDVIRLSHFSELLIDEYGPGITVDQIEDDIFGNGFALPLLLKYRVRKNLQHVYIYHKDRGSERTKVITFMFAEHRRQPEKVYPGIGTPIPFLSFYAHTGHLLFAHVAGHRGTVNAWWAYLMAQRNHGINGEYFSLSGKKDHFIKRRMLPSGLMELVIYSDLAILSDKKIEAKYIYFEDDGQNIPADFMVRLDKICPIPVLPEWEETLWVRGFKTRMLSPLLSNYIGTGMFAMSTDAKGWAGLISRYIKDGLLAFPSAETEDVST